MTLGVIMATKTNSEKSNLKQYLDNFFEMITLYDDNKEFKDSNGNVYHHDYKGLLKAAIDVFMEFESSYTAYEVYETFLMIYQITPEDKSDVDESSPNSLISEPNTLLNLVRIMKDYEENTGDLINRQRDHFIHSVNVFILGLAIYAQNKAYRNIFFNYITKNKHYKKFYKINGKFSHEEFLYRWGIAALFHDIGYPFEIIGKQLDKVIEDGVKSISINYDVKGYIDFRDFNEFNSIVKVYPYNYADEFRGRYKHAKLLDLFKPTDIMAHKIAMDFKFDNNQFKKLIKHLNSFVKYMNEVGFIDHGYFSAILVLNSYGKLIQKYVDKNKDFFFYPIVDSATAILLHNYYNKTLQSNLFGLGKLNPSDSPISYLLILCDELQEWNRRPYGVLDKRKNHVNDLNVEINEEQIIIRYILKNGAMGLGFEQDKGIFINKVLDINKIFPGNLAILPKVELDDIQRDIFMSDVKAPDVLLRNIERFANEINEEYNESIRYQLQRAKEEGDKKNIEKYSKKVKKLCSLSELPSSLKMSNIRQAKSIPKKLSMIGCEIAHKTAEEMADTTDFDEKIDTIIKFRVESGEFTQEEAERMEIIEVNDKIARILKFGEDDVEDLAVFEHDDWWEERKGTGWIFGEKENRDLKINPNLVDWDELDEPTKDFDRDTIRNIPKILDNIGLKVVRNKLRLLTYKMNQVYEKDELDANSSGEEEFKGLEKHIQFSNLKQADYLVKILNENGYELVELNDPREAVDSFSDDEIEYFAKREHEGWYKLKLNLNETNGKNFVKWDELNEKVKEKNRQTFKYLPQMCADDYVLLKVVREE